MASICDIIVKNVFQNAKNVDDLCQLIKNGKDIVFSTMKIPAKYKNVSSTHQSGKCKHQYKKSSDFYKKNDFCNSNVEGNNDMCSVHNKKKSPPKKASNEYKMEGKIVVSHMDGSKITDDEKKILISQGLKVKCNGISKKSNEPCKNSVRSGGDIDLLCTRHFSSNKPEAGVSKKDKEDKETTKEATKEATKEDKEVTKEDNKGKIEEDDNEKSDSEESDDSEVDEDTLMLTRQTINALSKINVKNK